MVVNHFYGNRPRCSNIRESNGRCIRRTASDFTIPKLSIRTVIYGDVCDLWLCGWMRSSGFLFYNGAMNTAICHRVQLPSNSVGIRKFNQRESTSFNQKQNGSINGVPSNVNIEHTNRTWKSFTCERIRRGFKLNHPMRFMRDRSVLIKRFWLPFWIPSGENIFQKSPLLIGLQSKLSLSNFVTAFELYPQSTSLGIPS